MTKDDGGFIMFKISTKEGDFSAYLDIDKEEFWRKLYTGMAMQGMLASTTEEAENAAQEFSAISVLAYRMADALIAEGRKGEE